MKYLFEGKFNNDTMKVYLDDKNILNLDIIDNEGLCYSFYLEDKDIEQFSIIINNFVSGIKNNKKGG